MTSIVRTAWIFWIALGLQAAAAAADARTYERKEDVVYGRKYGVALTLDVFTPKDANGAAVIFAVSGGWFSAHEAINVAFFGELLARGYTVFAVVHGSQPKFAIPEIAEDMHRAVRFIRYNAGRFGIDPARIGIMGASAGGHLSLLLGTSGKPGSSDARDPVDRESSRVQAVACFFPPTDFLNFGTPGRDVLQALEGELSGFRAPFDFVERDPKAGRLVVIESREKRLEIARDISPVTHVSADDPPTLIIHGDADKLVPIQQAQVFEEKMRAAGAKVKLVVKSGAGHGWPDILKDLSLVADWFDEHLKKAETEKAPR
ncbi:MAG: alpha/beta fold hydrolase [Planctomycetota bacterium]